MPSFVACLPSCRSLLQALLSKSCRLLCPPAPGLAFVQFRASLVVGHLPLILCIIIFVAQLCAGILLLAAAQYITLLCLLGCSVGWLVGHVLALLFGLLEICLVGWLLGCLVDWSVAWLVPWLFVYVVVLHPSTSQDPY